MDQTTLPPTRRQGISLVEILAVVTILGIVAVLIIPRFSDHALQAKRNTCFVNKGNIEVQCQLWRRQKGSAPLSSLSDIGANKTYFPEGLPTCPVDGSSYSLDSTTMQVNGHTH